MSEVASAYVSLIPSAKGFGAGISKELGGSTAAAGKKAGAAASKSFGGSFTSGMKRVVAPLAAVFAGAKVIDFFKDSVNQASDLNEAGTALAQVFGKKGLPAVQKFAAGGAKALGQSKLDVENAAQSFGVYGKAAGLAGKENAKFSTHLVGLSTDLASFYNTSPEEAVQAIAAGLRGESEPLRRFGVLLDDATLRQQAMKMGLIKTTKEALTPQNKVLAAQAVIMKQSRVAQGDFQRTSGGLANQQRILAAQFEDVKGTIGKALLPVILNLVKTMNTSVIPAVTGLIDGFKNGTGAGGKLADALGMVKAAFAAAAPFIGAVVKFIKDNPKVVATFAGVILTVVAAVKAWSIAQAILNVVLTANPIGIVVVAIAALAAGLVYAYKHSETFRKIVDAAFQGIAKVAKWLWDNVLSRIFKLWKLEFELIGKAGIWLWNNALQPTFKFIVKGVGWLMQTWGKMLSTLGKVPGFGWAKAAGETMKAAGQKAIDMADSIKKIPDRKATDVTTPGLDKARKALDAYKWTLDHIRPEVRTQILTQHTDKFNRVTGARASGGPVLGGNTYLVGEKGPELFTAPTSGHITPNSQLGGARGASIVQNVYDRSGNPQQTAADSARYLRFAGAI